MAMGGGRGVGRGSFNRCAHVSSLAYPKHVGNLDHFLSHRLLFGHLGVTNYRFFFPLGVNDQA